MGPHYRVLRDRALTRIDKANSDGVNRLLDHKPARLVSVALASKLARIASDVEVGHVERVFLDELAARFDHVAHQPGEDLVGDVGVLDLDLEEEADPGVERGLHSCSAFISPSPL